MTHLHVMNSNNGTDLIGAEIIHRDTELLIIAMPTKDLPNDNDKDFWAMEEKFIIFNAEDGTGFKAKAWTHSDTINNIAIIKFYSGEQEWFI